MQTQPDPNQKMSTFGGQTKRPEQWGKQWCQYCKMFVQNSKIAQKQHEQSDKHQFAMKRLVRSIYKKTDQQKRQEDMTKRELERIEKVVGEPKSKDRLDAKPRLPVAPSSGLNSSNPGPTMEEQADLQRLLAEESTKIGEWQPVEKPELVQELLPNAETATVKRPRKADIAEFVIEERKHPIAVDIGGDPLGILGNSTTSTTTKSSTTTTTANTTTTPTAVDSNSLFKRKKAKRSNQ